MLRIASDVVQRKTDVEFPNIVGFKKGSSELHFPYPSLMLSLRMEGLPSNLVTQQKDELVPRSWMTGQIKEVVALIEFFHSTDRELRLFVELEREKA